MGVRRTNGSSRKMAQMTWIHAHMYVPFAVKIETFVTPDPQNRQNLPNFGRDRKFSLDLSFNIGGLRSKHPLLFIGAQ